MKDKAYRKALIYCRVSHVKQSSEGDGLQSQEHRCRQFAAERGYIVEEVFHDELTGFGGFMSRPGMVAMLRFLARHSHDDYVVIFDDLKRFARDTEFHLALRRKLANYNARVECLNFKFEDTPEGRFIETIIAAQGELERTQGRRQTVQKMKARLERGYCVFKAPVGYRYAKSEGEGMVLVRNEPLASIVREALESYACGRFQLQSEVKRFLEMHPEFPRDHRNEVRGQQVTDILTRVIYAGYVEAPNWGVAIHKGRHEPLISFETFQQIQDRLRGKARAPIRENIREEFPLRGAVHCGECHEPLTGYWAKGKSKSYPYYHCHNRSCGQYGKSIKRERIEEEFEALLKTAEPPAPVFEVARLRLQDLWKHREAATAERLRSLKSELANIDKETQELVGRIVRTDVPPVIAAYENRIRELHALKIAIEEKMAARARPARTFEQTVRTSLRFLASPCTLWNSERLEDKRAVLRLVFIHPIRYVRGSGFLEPDFSLPFSMLQVKSDQCAKWRPQGDSNPRYRRERAMS